jgi:hypothetical protein
MNAMFFGVLSYGKSQEIQPLSHDKNSTGFFISDSNGSMGNDLIRYAVRLIGKLSECTLAAARILIQVEVKTQRG